MKIVKIVETWKQIAHELGRSERWCRYMASREKDPLPLAGKLGGIVRAEVSELAAWVKRQTDDSKFNMLGRSAGSGICTKCDDRIPLRADGAVKAHEVLFRQRIQRCVGAGRFPKEGTVESTIVVEPEPDSRVEDGETHAEMLAVFGVDPDPEGDTYEFDDAVTGPFDHGDA